MGVIGYNFFYLYIYVLIYPFVNVLTNLILTLVYIYASLENNNNMSVESCDTDSMLRKILECAYDN